MLIHTTPELRLPTTTNQIMFLEDMFTNAAAAGGGRSKRGNNDMDDDPDMADPSLGTSSDNPTLLYLKGLLAWKQVRSWSWSRSRLHCRT